jgi:DNA (cytosine-5)-methyltransferase 1
MKFIDLFAGIGGIRIPFEELGYTNVFSSEMDGAAAKTYEANFGCVPHGDITKIAEESIPKHDLLLAGFPCQAFSIMGKKLGFSDTRGTLFFEVQRVLKFHKPSVVFLENVKQLVTHDGGRTLEVILSALAEIGYHTKWTVLDARNFGLPQKRERVIIVGFLSADVAHNFNFNFDKVKYDLNEIIEPDENVDKKLFASPHILEKRMERVKDKIVFYPSIWHENKSGNISILDHACALRTGASYNYLLINGYRRPSSRELLRLQGFPDSYKIVVSHAEIRRQTGNSVPVRLIRAVAKNIDLAIKLSSEKLAC